MVDAQVDGESNAIETVNDSEGEAVVQQRRRRGRPRGQFDATINWLSIEKEYLYGDPLEAESNDPAIPKPRHYPSLRELGARHGVHYSLIGRKAKALGWAKRRESFKKALDEETDRAVAKSAALSTADAVGIIDTWVGRFEENLRGKRVRADSVGDLNTVLRLREFLLGNADTRTETSTAITLEAMQARFRDRRGERQQAGDALAAAALAGVLDEPDRMG